MSLQFFIVGGLIFGFYMILTVWNIFYSTQKQEEENSKNSKSSKESDSSK
jgi:hypothetical protein